MTGQFRIEHGPAGVARLVARCLELEPDPAEVRVVLETRHGLLVEVLVDAGLGCPAFSGQAFLELFYAAG